MNGYFRRRSKRWIRYSGTQVILRRTLQSVS